MAADDYLADYAELGLEPGCSLHALERAWRRAVSELHPDRAAVGERADHSARLREISVSYQRLRQFEREHGRLPGEALPMPVQPLTPLVVVDDAPASFGPTAIGNEPSNPRASTGSRLWLWPAFVLVGLGLASVDWSSSSDAPGVAAQVSPRKLATASMEFGQDSDDHDPERSAPRRIRIGTSEAQVELLMGTPITVSRDLWEYGPSHVRFDRGRVIGWYSSPLKPLPVDQDQR